MPSSPPSFIRYFAHTDESPLGRTALEYIKALIRIAPVRLASLSGCGLEGAWKAHAVSLFTPMTGTYVNAVCCHPSRWRWNAVVHTTESDIQFGDTHEQFGKAPAASEVVERVEELYTVNVRNLLFMTMPPPTKELMMAAKKYEAVIAPNLEIPAYIAREYPDLRFEGSVIPVPVEGSSFKRIRELVLGAS